MTDAAAALMLLSAGLFAGGGATFAWSRVPIWRRLGVAEFTRDFEATLRLTDKVQPLLLVVALASGAAFSISAESSPRVLGALGTAGLAVTLMASLAFLVPLQRRIIREAPGSDDERIEVMRRRWFSGNLGRSVLSVASFALLVAGSLA